jgi:hypothetical protein
MIAKSTTLKASLDNDKPMPSAEVQLKAFVRKFDSKHQMLIRATRRWLRRRLPTAHELVYDNYNFFVIGYSATGRPSDAVLSIAASARGVGLCFTYGKALPDPQKLLRGSGNQTRSIHLDSASALARPAMVRLIDEAVKRSRVQFSRSGKGVLVIRSISAKQRPRRRTD